MKSLKELTESGGRIWLRIDELRDLKPLPSDSKEILEFSELWVRLKDAEKNIKAIVGNHLNVLKWELVGKMCFDVQEDEMRFLNSMEKSCYENILSELGIIEVFDD